MPNTSEYLIRDAVDKKRRIEHYKNLIADIDKQIQRNRDYEKVLDLATDHFRMVGSVVYDEAYPEEIPASVAENHHYYMNELNNMAASYISLNILLDDISDALLHITDDMEECQNSVQE